MFECHRCKGEGSVWWFGRPGLGGRWGPCPKCRPYGARQFVESFRRKIWGDAEEHRARRQHKFQMTFTGGNEHG